MGLAARSEGYEGARSGQRGGGGSEGIQKAPPENVFRFARSSSGVRIMGGNGRARLVVVEAKVGACGLARSSADDGRRTTDGRARETSDVLRSTRRRSRVAGWARPSHRAQASSLRLVAAKATSCATVHDFITLLTARLYEHCATYAHRQYHGYCRVCFKPDWRRGAAATGSCTKVSSASPAPRAGSGTVVARRKAKSPSVRTHEARENHQDLLSVPGRIA
jgi:hypothetical protein